MNEYFHMTVVEFGNGLYFWRIVGVFSSLPFAEDVGVEEFIGYESCKVFLFVFFVSWNK